MFDDLKIYIPNETTSNSVGANDIYEIIIGLEGSEKIELSLIHI